MCDLPSEHAAKHVREGVRLLQGKFGRTLAEVQATGLFPEFLPAWAAAFCVGGYDDKGTADTAPGGGWRNDDGSYQKGAFDELGRWQTKGGLIVWRRSADGTIARDPSPGPDLAYNDWRTLARAPGVERAYGGAIPLRPGAWKNDLRAQACIGLAMLREHRDAMLRAVGPELRPADPAGPWAMHLALMGFSAGDAGAAAVVGAWRAALAGVDERARFKTLLVAAARDYASGARPKSGRRCKHAKNPYHTLVRQLQKALTALAIARAAGLDTGPFELGDVDAVERVLTAADDHARCPAVELPPLGDKSVP